MAEYVKHTGGSVAGKSKQPYDAMVYKDTDSGYTIAVDGNGNVIKKVLSSANTDDIVIQYLIDKSTSNYNILISNGNYNISTRLSFSNKDTVQITGCGQQTNFVLGADIGFLKLDGKVIHCKFDNFRITIGATNTSDIISIVPSTSDYVDWTVFSNITIYNTNSSNYGWNGLKIAPINTGHVLGNTITNFLVWKYCTKGIVFANAGGGNNAWSNANIFSDIFIWWPVIGVDFTDAQTGCANDSNTFRRVHVQVESTRTTYGFKNIYRMSNVFTDCVVWDWPVAAAGVYQYSFDSRSVRNVIYSSQEGGLATSVSILDGGNQNLIIDPRRTLMQSHNLVVVSDDTFGLGKSSLSSVLSSITDASDTNRYVIAVFGYIEETTQITPKSYIDVIGIGNAVIDVNSDSAISSIYFGPGVSNTTWSNLTIRRSGSPGSNVQVIDTHASVSSGVVLDNLNVIGNVTSARCHGIVIRGSPIIKNSYIAPSGTTGTNGLNITSIGVNPSPQIMGCIVQGSSTGTTAGIYSDSNSGNPIIKDCIIYAGTGADCRGIYNQGEATYDSCVVYYGNGGAGNLGISVDGSSSANFISCSARPLTTGYSHAFTGSNNTILPFSTHPYFLNTVLVYVSVAGAGGSTLGIGTSPGGTEIASGIPTSTIGTKLFSFTKRSFAGDSLIYLTFSDTNTRATVYYSVAHNYTDCYAIRHAGYGYVKYSSCSFNSNMASSCGYITSTAVTDGKYKFVNCLFNSNGTYDFSAAVPGVIKAIGCIFENGLTLNVTLPGQGTAATITAGNTYIDVTHSLASTPTKVHVTPTTNLGTRSFWVDTKGASTFRININSSDVIDHTFDWEAEV